MTESQRIKLARVVAAAADLLEIVVFPAFVEGALSPVNDVVDTVVAAILVWLLGWHWAFLPAFASELIPVWGLVPTWTAAVYLVTRGRAPAPDTAGEPSTVIDVTPSSPPSHDPRRRS